MSQDEAAPEGESADGPSVPLTRLERTLAGGMGLLMIGGGTTAVFTRKVEAGPTALITVGALLVVIAISGVSIKRARIGDNEITLHNRQAAALQLSRTPADELDAALSVLAAYDPAAVTDPSIRMAISGAYTSAVLSSLERKFGSNVSRFKHSFDAEVALDVGMVAIEIQHFQSADRNVRAQLRHKVRNFASRIERAESEYRRIAILSNVDVPQSVQEKIDLVLVSELEASNLPRVSLRYIVLENPSDEEEVSRKLSAAFPSR
ncbi:hypothetical protein [Streptomyces dioscori]|uniref:hypothetical protein n=1 Tax=Streptomyces dioscori TaxID=2109333 RepID=UPI00131CD019|nr:hypothetical protein [Streptomyces dioscori]